VGWIVDPGRSVDDLGRTFGEIFARWTRGALEPGPISPAMLANCNRRALTARLAQILDRVAA